MTYLASLINVSCELQTLGMVKDRKLQCCSPRSQKDMTLGTEQEQATITSKTTEKTGHFKKSLAEWMKKTKSSCCLTPVTDFLSLSLDVTSLHNTDN